MNYCVGGGSRRRRAELLQSKSFNRRQGGRGAPEKPQGFFGERRSDGVSER